MLWYHEKSLWGVNQSVITIRWFIKIHASFILVFFYRWMVTVKMIIQSSLWLSKIIEITLLIVKCDESTSNWTIHTLHTTQYHPTIPTAVNPPVHSEKIIYPLIFDAVFACGSKLFCLQPEPFFVYSRPSLYLSTSRDTTSYLYLSHPLRFLF